MDKNCGNIIVESWPYIPTIKQKNALFSLNVGTHFYYYLIASGKIRIPDLRILRIKCCTTVPREHRKGDIALAKTVSQIQSWQSWNTLSSRSGCQHIMIFGHPVVELGQKRPRHSKDEIGLANHVSQIQRCLSWITRVSIHCDLWSPSSWTVAKKAKAQQRWHYFGKPSFPDPKMAVLKYQGDGTLMVFEHPSSWSWPIRGLGLYTQNFIFLVTYEWAQ
jgi:hypothetical protein